MFYIGVQKVLGRKFKLPVKFKHFPAGELMPPKIPDSSVFSFLHFGMDRERCFITWLYESDEDVFILYNLKRALDEMGVKEVSLEIAYLPHARMDRIHAPFIPMFTLKNLAEIINSLNFYTIDIFDVHSDVSLALINKSRNITPASYIHDILNDNQIDTIVFPDAGAKKRYEDFITDKEIYYCNKKRDYDTGKILDVKVESDTEDNIDLSGKTVLIIDDICSKGFTFYFTAKKLKDLGAKQVLLFVSHLEDSVKDGELLKTNYIDKIFTVQTFDKSKTFEDAKIEYLRKEHENYEEE